MGQSRRIAVVRFRDEYRIVAQDGSWGRFKFRVDAEEAALRLSARARATGDRVDVLVQESFGELHALDPSEDDPAEQAVGAPGAMESGGIA